MQTCLRVRLRLRLRNLAFTAALAGAAGPLWAGPGQLDRRFGAGGTVVYAYGCPTSVSTNRAVGLLSLLDRFVVAGTLDDAQCSSGAQFIEIRRGEKNGTTTAGVGLSVGGGADLAVQPDDKVVVAGRFPPLCSGCGSDFVLMRVTPQTSDFDLTFGSTGYVHTDFGGEDEAAAVAIQPDGRIVAAGRTDGNLALARYLTDGSLDPSFGGGGKHVTNFGPGTTAVATDIAVQPDGKLLVVGHLNGDFLAIRHLANGLIDTSFGNLGFITVDFGGNDTARGLALLPDGRFVMAGSSDGFIALTRRQPDGSPDLSFGTLGKVTVGFSQPASANAVALQRDGKIVVTGQGRSSCVAAARFLPDGSLDGTFDAFGYTGSGASPACGLPGTAGYGVAIRPDGRILIAGDLKRADPPQGVGIVVQLEGDPPTSIGVYRPSTQAWFLRNANTHGFNDVPDLYYGAPGDVPVVGDWDGDGVDTIGVYRPSERAWYLRNSNTQGGHDVLLYYGADGDIPVVGDWDGDGVDTIGVYRPSEHAWYLRNSNTQGFHDLLLYYGADGDLPVVGDWNGDGVDTIGVYRPSERAWYLRNSNTPGFHDLLVYYGADGDVPVVGDWSADRVDTVGVYRPSEHTWYLRTAMSNEFHDVPAFAYGMDGDIPLVGNWDGMP